MCASKRWAGIPWMQRRNAGNFKGIQAKQAVSRKTDPNLWHAHLEMYSYFARCWWVYCIKNIKFSPILRSCTWRGVSPEWRVVWPCASHQFQIVPSHLYFIEDWQQKVCISRPAAAHCHQKQVNTQDTAYCVHVYMTRAVVQSSWMCHVSCATSHAPRINFSCSMWQHTLTRRFRQK